jgi:uncharacterized membrane protein YbhN (UPF0104 family)
MVVRFSPVTRLWHLTLESLTRLSAARPGWVAAALALHVVSLFIVGARWRGFLRMLGARVTILRATLATLGGIAVGNLTPSSRLAGEACRVTLAHVDSEDITWPGVAVAAGWDRLSELPPVAVLIIMAAVAVGNVTGAGLMLLLVPAILVAVAGAVVAVNRTSGTRDRLRQWRDRVALDRCDFKVFATGVGWSSLMWVQDVLRIACAGYALGVTLPPTRIAALSVIAMLGGLAPTIGGLGAVEGGLVGGLVAFGVDAPTAAAITAVERSISFGFSTAAGVLVVTLLGGRSLLNAARRGLESARSPQTRRTPAVETRP